MYQTVCSPTRYLLYSGREEKAIETRKETPQDRYHKAHTKSYVIRMMKRTEADIIEKLESVPNKAGYIKSLIRADIEKNR